MSKPDDDGGPAAAASWRFPDSHRKRLRAALAGFAEPDRMVLTIEWLAAMLMANADIRVQAADQWSDALSKHRRKDMEEVRDNAVALLKALSLSSGVGNVISFALAQPLARVGPIRDLTLAEGGLARIGEVIYALRSLRQVTHQLLAGRGPLHQRVGRPAGLSNTRRILADHIGKMIGGAAPSRARQKTEQALAGDWRDAALQKALRLVFECIGGRPHEKDLKPLLARARAAMKGAAPAR